jgi:hypothetical protein
MVPELGEETNLCPSMMGTHGGHVCHGATQGILDTMAVLKARER